MREIKFKVAHYEAKFINKKGWIIPKNSKPKIYPFEEVQWGTDLTPISFINKKGIFRVNNPYDKCILLQFTGLKDKKGKEIYEGDIIEWVTDIGIDNGNRGRVLFSYEGIWKIAEGIGEFGNFKVYNQTHQIKVIGNIYENPELLKEVKRKWQD